MRVIRILPEMKHSHFLSMFHQGIDGQWPPSDLPWEQRGSESPELRGEVALWAAPFAREAERAIRVTSQLIPRLSLAKATEAQLYLITLQLDKARQFHVFDRLISEEGAERDPDGLEAFAPYPGGDPVEGKPGDPTSKVWEIQCVTALSRALLAGLKETLPSPWFQEAADHVLGDQARQLAFLREYLSASVSRESLESDPDGWAGRLGQCAECFYALSDEDKGRPYAAAAEQRGIALHKLVADAVRTMELQLDALVADSSGDADEEAQFV